MKVKHYCGDNPLIEYSEEEIIEMYLSEGVSPEEARRRAKLVKQTIHNLNRNEKLLWSKM